MTAPSTQNASAQLSIRTPNGDTQSVVLNADRYNIGRLSSNQLSFQGIEGLSREHLAIERQGDEWVVRDLGSTNGTYVNGTRITEPVRLRSNDQITAGQLALTFTSEEKGAPRDVVFVENTTQLDVLTTTATLDAVLAAEQATSGGKHMRALIRAGRELAGRMPLEKLFDLILNLSVETVGAARGALMILEEGELQVRATKGEGFRISSSVRDLVINERRSLLVQDVMSNQALAGRESIVAQQIKSILAVPLQTEERVIGLVYLDSPFLIHEFKNEDLNLLTVMANIAAIRIENTRLAQIEQAEKILAKELEHAALIQRSILPGAFPAFPDRSEFSLHAEMAPAREVGGDLYDFFLLDHDHLGFVIGDVSGKGVPAALFMAVTRTLIRAIAPHQKSPGECFAQVNAALMEQNASSMFVTLFYGVLNLHTGELEFANGGHNPAYVVSRDGAFRELAAKSGPMLGLFPNYAYRTLSDRLAPGESIVLYTDGVTEALSKSGEFFGDERLKQFVAEHARETVEQQARSLHAVLREFSKGAPQHDDITVLALRYR